MKSSFPSLSGRRAYGLAVACVVISAGAIVLLKARGQVSASPQAQLSAFDLSASTPQASRGQAAASEVPRLAFSHPGFSGTLSFTQGAVEAGARRPVIAELRLTADDDVGRASRQPVALAVALDVSGSMTGDKLEEARLAVASLLASMSDDDLVSVVVYNDSTRLWQPLGRLGEVRRSLLGSLGDLEAGGGTNIPPALEVAAAQLRQADGRHVRRVVLVSDGNDHSGWDLARVAALVREQAGAGNTFSSLGVGTDYSEAFMTGVADAGRGNYAFLERGADLRPFLQRELDQASRTLADSLVATLRLPPGWRLSACYGAEALGQLGDVTIPLGALVVAERRRVVLSLEVDAAAGQTPPISLALAYQHRPTGQWQRLATGGLALAVTSDRQAVAASTDAAAHADSLTTVVDLQQARSIEAWRGGDRAAAVALTNDNIAQLGQLQALSFSEERARRIDEYRQDIGNFNDNEASSQVGRTYGLSSNFQRRSRARGW